MFITADTQSIRTHAIPERPSPAKLVALRSFPTPLLGDAMGRLNLMDGALKPLFPEAHCAGPALTVLTREGDNLAIHCALDEAEPGDILVINGFGGSTRAVFGDLLAEICLARGVAGVILDGFARDASTMEQLGLPVWCRGTSPAGPFKHGPGAVGAPVACGGLVVNSGDIVIADADGVAVVPAADISAVASRAEDAERNEGTLRARIRDSATPTPART